MSLVFALHQNEWHGIRHHQHLNVQKKNWYLSQSITDFWIEDCFNSHGLYDVCCSPTTYVSHIAHTSSNDNNYGIAASRVNQYYIT